MQPRLIFDYKFFSKELRRERELAELSMRGLARELDMTHVTIFRIENYESIPSLDTILKFINFLDMNIYDFFIDVYN